jgi:DNA-binding winged helix-turn-helix (wHTH) protein
MMVDMLKRHDITSPMNASHPKGRADSVSTDVQAGRSLYMTSRVGDQPIYEFGPFQLDPTEYLLVRDHQPVRLTPKAFDLLVYLVERHGRLVAKPALLSALWPSTSVEETNLAYHVSALRKILDEGRNGTSAIQTVPTKGYRFTVPVTPRVRMTPASSRDRQNRWRHAWSAGVALAMLVVLWALIWSLWWNRVGSAPPARVLSLTAVPAQAGDPSLSIDGDQVVFTADGGGV